MRIGDPSLAKAAKHPQGIRSLDVALGLSSTRSVHLVPRAALPAPLN